MPALHCSPGLVGLAIANTLDLAAMANWVLRQLSETEVAMNRCSPALLLPLLSHTSSLREAVVL